MEKILLKTLEKNVVVNLDKIVGFRVLIPSKEALILRDLDKELSKKRVLFCWSSSKSSHPLYVLKDGDYEKEIEEIVSYVLKFKICKVGW